MIVSLYTEAWMTKLNILLDFVMVLCIWNATWLREIPCNGQFYHVVRAMRSSGAFL